MPGLSITDIVNVPIIMAPTAVPVRNFGTLILAGPSPVIDVNERLREYTTLDGVTADFGTEAPEYLAADAFYAQSPQPSVLYIGRFAQTASSGVLHGGILSATQQMTLLQQLSLVTDGTMQITIDGTQRLVEKSSALLTSGVFTAAAQGALLTNLQGIANGAFALTISGTAVDTGPISFAAITTLEEAAEAIQAAATISPLATVTWNATTGQFVLATIATGGTQSVTYASAPAAGTDISGILQLAAGSGATVTQGADGMNFSGITNLNGAAQILSYALSGGVCVWDGTRFNITSVSSGPTSTVSYATSAGVGQDVSVMLQLTSGVASVPVGGIAAETALACANALRAHPEWYALAFALTTDIAQSDYEAVASFIEGCSPPSVFLYTTQNSQALDPTVTTDLPSVLMGESLQRSFGQYSSASPYAAVSLFARFATIDFQGSNTMITGKFKQEPTILGEVLTENEAAALKGKNCNVFVYYSVGVSIVQEAVMANGYFIDERIGMDACANQVQTDLFNVLYQAPKVPQTDAGVHLLVTTVANSLVIFVNNGFIAPGQWNGPPIGQLQTGQQLPLGYYIFAPLVASQPQSIRETRVAPTLQAAIKLAGAIHFAECIISVNR
jgi:hypothetical protein